LGDYPIPDNLDSWACALTFIPKENPLGQTVSIPSGIGKVDSATFKEEEKEMLQLLE
jgi:hypothetical protein